MNRSQTNNSNLKAALDRRRNVYLAKRDERDALEDDNLNEWAKYEFAAEAIEWLAGDLGIEISERPENPLATLEASEAEVRG